MPKVPTVALSLFAVVGALAMGWMAMSVANGRSGIAPLQSLAAVVPEQDQGEFFEAVRSYAHAGGFVFSLRETRPGGFIFELKRYDLHVIGLNASSLTYFKVGVYPNRNGDPSPPVNTAAQLLDDLTAALAGIRGVAVAPLENW